MDQIAQIRAFVRTVERGSQSEAARDLGITPAMVGRHIRALEERLGARLLHRSTARQSLTEAGALFHARAASVLEELAAAEAAVTDRQAEPGGTLRISAPVVFGARYLAAVLARFSAAHPRLAVEMTLNDRQVDLIEEGFDLAVRIGNLDDSALVARRLAPCRLMLVAAPSYLAERGWPASPDDLVRHDYLAYAYASGGRTVRFSGPGGRVVRVELRGRFAANNGEALNEAAMAGAGVVLSPSFIAGDALRDGRLRHVLPEWSPESLGVHAVFPTGRQLPTKVRACIDHLAATFGDDPVWDRGLEAAGSGPPPGQ